MSQRLDQLYAQKPRATVEVYLELVGQELYEICLAFPPHPSEIAFANALEKQRFVENHPYLRQPDASFMILLAQVLAWEIDRELERLDHFFRNDGPTAVCASQAQVFAFHFLQQLLLERLLSRQETSSHQLKRRDLLRSIERFRFLSQQLA